MGLRGPHRNPNSRRGQEEIRKRQRLAESEQFTEAGQIVPRDTPTEGVQQSLPLCPKGLPRRVAETWNNLVIDLAAAKVPIKQIDSYAIVMAARCLVSVEEAEELAGDHDLEPEQRLAALRLKAQFGKDLQQWLQLICATPGSRARIGIKPPVEKPKGALAKILEAKMRRA